MSVPERARPTRPGDYLAILTRAIFQAGLSWRVVDAKWPAFERLFADFDPILVAAFGDDDVERLLADGGIVRSRKKIVATIHNARTLLAIERAMTIETYLRSFATYAELADDLRARFAYLGDLSAYYVLFRLGEAVPRFEAWETTVAGDHPRMREMVAHARALGHDETVPLGLPPAPVAHRVDGSEIGTPRSGTSQDGAAPTRARADGKTPPAVTKKKRT